MTASDDPHPTIYGDVSADLARMIDDAYAKIEKLGVNGDKALGDAIGKALEKTGLSLAATLNRNAPKMLREHRRKRRGFERRLRRHYRSGFDLFYQVYVAATEFGSDFNQTHRDGAAREQDFKFEALTSIHARACMVTSEIFALLCTGHPDGAQARWRTLHELAVVASVLAESNQGIAERYLLHAVIDNYKDAKYFTDVQDCLNEGPLEDGVLGGLHEQRLQLLKRFGRNFNDDWGWANPLFEGKQKATFRALEDLAGLPHLRPYYRRSSHSTHGGRRGAELARVPAGDGEAMLAGSTNLGLTIPAQSALISLTQATVALAISGRPEAIELMTTPILHALLKLTDDAGNAFVEAEQAIEARTIKSWSPIRRSAAT